MLARVSSIETHRQWLNWKPLFDGQEEPTLEDHIRFLTVDEPTEQMMAGTAFHKALETAQDGEHDALSANGYTFHLPDAELSLPAMRELRGYRQYGPLTVTGQVDGIEGVVITDHKTTSRFDLERYLDGCQWRFYLEIFDADVFVWNVFEIKETDPKVYRVKPPQIMRAYRYPGMASDCERLAADFYDFACSVNLPDAQIAA